MNFSSGEIILTSAARLINNRDRILLSSGPSNLVFALASRLHAPESMGYYSNGIVRSNPITPVDRIPGNPSNLRGAHRLCSVLDTLGALQDGRINTSIIAAEQVDYSGDLNPLSGLNDVQVATGTVPEGNSDTTSLTPSVITMIPHENERLVEQLEHPQSRRNHLSEHSSGGPVDYLVTDLARFERTRDKNWTLVGTLEDVSEEEIKKQTGFPIKTKDSLETIETPTSEELEIIRSFDTEGLWKNL